MQEKVKEALDKVRVSLQADGGDVELIGVDDKGVVKLRLTGARGGCPMTSVTLKTGIERVLKQEVPQIKRVEAV